MPPFGCGLEIFQTLSGDYVDALATYLKIVKAWPRLALPRYRLAALLSFEEELSKQWRQRIGEKRSHADARALVLELARVRAATAKLVGIRRSRAVLWELCAQVKDERGLILAVQRRRRALTWTLPQKDRVSVPSTSDLLRAAIEQWVAIETMTAGGSVSSRELKRGGFPHRSEFLLAVLLADYCTELQTTEMTHEHDVSTLTAGKLHGSLDTTQHATSPCL